jgi:hypothetical protein
MIIIKSLYNCIAKGKNTYFSVNVGENYLHDFTTVTGAVVAQLV